MQRLLPYLLFSKMTEYPIKSEYTTNIKWKIFSTYTKSTNCIDIYKEPFFTFYFGHAFIYFFNFNTAGILKKINRDPRIFIIRNCNIICVFPFSWNLNVYKSKRNFQKKFDFLKFFILFIINCKIGTVEFNS